MKHTKTANEKLAHVNKEVLSSLRALYLEAFAHDGFAEIRVEMRILRRGQKEVILHCGKQYRFVVDFKGLADDKRQERKDDAANASAAAALTETPSETPVSPSA
jgi:hypothetical protein